MKHARGSDNPQQIAGNMLSSESALHILRVIGAGPSRFGAIQAPIFGESKTIVTRRLQGPEEAGITRPLFGLNS